jgi:peroxiredoxin
MRGRARARPSFDSTMTNETPTVPRRDSLTNVLLVGCVALAVCVIALAWQNLSLKKRLSAPAHGGEELETLAQGEVVAPFDVVTMAGETVRVGFDEGQERTILLVFSSTCPACERNMPVWNELLGGEPKASVRVLGVQTDLAPGGTPHTGGPPCPIYAAGRRGGPPFDRLPYVPATVVLDRDGRVRSAWFGVLDADQQTELRREIGA